VIERGREDRKKTYSCMTAGTVEEVMSVTVESNHLHTVVLPIDLHLRRQQQSVEGGY
jgi:hypothetical protein